MQYFYYNEKSEYPNDKYYRPAVNYPEYQFSEYGFSERNDVYEMIRNTFIGMGLDRINIGKPSWNPLGEYIKKGDTVLIKPNLVTHINYKVKVNGLDCLVTHPSVLRCVIDYVLIALSGTGKIIVADAPIQDCKFDVLLREGGYNRITSFYKNVGIPIEIEDLRLVAGREEGVAGKERIAAYESVEVDLGELSYFSKMTNSHKFRITNYDYHFMNKYHHNNIHKYCVSSCCLEADVILSLPKPKTHRLAGYTGALKNMVGINSRKECLPHHTKGSKQSGGDEYRKRSILKKIQSEALDIKNYALLKSWRNIANLASFVSRNLEQLTKKYSSNTMSNGAWYGNDTVWRTVMDLYYIVQYCDKTGNIKKKKQRQLISIGDMIISGENEGPLSPTPKRVGGILMSDDAMAFDLFLTKLMGLKQSKIPMIRDIIKSKKYNLNKLYLSSNRKEFSGTLKELKKDFNFTPSSGWKAAIGK